MTAVFRAVLPCSGAVGSSTCAVTNLRLRVGSDVFQRISAAGTGQIRTVERSRIPSGRNRTFAKLERSEHAIKQSLKWGAYIKTPIGKHSLVSVSTVFALRRPFAAESFCNEVEGKFWIVASSYHETKRSIINFVDALLLVLSYFKRLNSVYKTVNSLSRIEPSYWRTVTFWKQKLFV